MIPTFIENFVIVLGRPTLLYALIAALATLGVAVTIFRTAILSAAKRGLRHAWPMLLTSLGYGLLFVKVPPAPIVAFVARDTTDIWNAARIVLLGLSLALTYRELNRAYCERDQLAERVRELEGAR